MTKRLCLSTAVLIGAGAAIKAVFMIVLPPGAYLALPSLTTTAAANRRVVRDIGIAFLFVGDVVLVGASKPAYRVLLWGAGSAWLAGNALIHISQVVAGTCAPSVLVRDIPTLTLPALIGAALTFWAVRDRGIQAAPGRPDSARPQQS